MPLEGPHRLLEALIFASPEPVSAQKIADAAEALDADSIPAMVAELNTLYEAENHSFRIVRAAGGYRFATTPEFGRSVRNLLAGAGRLRLSRAAVETLSIIAYKQPVSKTDIESVRRVDAGGVLKLLLDRRLVKISGRSKGAGRALLYSTTQEFLKHFGLDSLADLPGIGELAAIKKVADPNQPELFAE